MSVNDYNEGLYEAVRDLVTAGKLNDTSDAYGIAMKMIHEGLASLSLAQRHVYGTKIEALLKRRAPMADYDPPPEN